MSIKLNDKEIEITALGITTENHGVYRRNVSFEADGETFDLEIVLGPNGTGGDFDDKDAFYAKNKDEVDAALQLHFSKNESESKN